MRRVTAEVCEEVSHTGIDIGKSCSMVRHWTCDQQVGLTPGCTLRDSNWKKWFTYVPSALEVTTIQCYRNLINWRAPWKNRICSTTMKLRKSPIKPVTRQNISSCSVLPPEIVMQDAFKVILWTSADIYVAHDDLRWKNRTRYNRFWRAGCSRLEYVDIRSVY